MWRLKEFNPQINKLSDVLPWAVMVAPGVIMNKDGSWQRTFQIRGKDLDSSTRSELITASAQLNNVLRRLGSGWAIYCEAQRIPSIMYPDSDFPDEITCLIDTERKLFFQSGQHYESVYYFTLVYLPPPEKQNQFESFFFQKDEAKKQILSSDMYESFFKNFMTETERIYYLLSEQIPECRILTDEETLTYLHSTVSEKHHKVVLPEIPMYLDAYIADSPFLGGFAPKLGNHFVGVVSILSFPGSATPGMLDALNRLDFEYRWVTRYICMDKLDAKKELQNYRRMWFAKRKSIGTMIKEQIMRSESAMVDTDALNKSGDADSAIEELDEDLVSYGYYTACVVVLDPDEDALEKKLRNVEKTINGIGFTTITEGLNAVDAWFGSIPCMCRSNVRRPILNTMNLAHLFPLSAIWAGPVQNKHLNAPPLMFTQTKGSSPFRLSLHVGDVGHTMIVGPTGAGKSVLLSLIAAQFRRYTDSQVYIFDKGGSCRALTAGVGGDFYDLAAEEGDSLSFQPLARIDEESEKIWAAEWILQYFHSQNVNDGKITPEIKQEVWNALGKLSSGPKDERTIYGLSLALQEPELRNAIQDMTIHGPYGKLFDSDSDSLNYGRWQVFEMEQLMNKKGAVMPTLDYLFHRLEQNCTGSPTLFLLDECWTFLDNPMFAAKIREWLKVMRKKNVSIIFATQNLDDIAKSSIAPAIMESCPTKILLPNPNALDNQNKELYYSFGLNDREREIIAMSTPKRHYYYKSVLGSRLFDLAMDTCSLAYCAASRPEDQTKVKEILARVGKEGFNEEWLRYKNVPEGIDFIRQLRKQTLANAI
jgi:type IV secretion/conjugal transfer VirB4 family ATPase